MGFSQKCHSKQWFSPKEKIRNVGRVPLRSIHLAVNLPAWDSLNFQDPTSWDQFLAVNYHEPSPNIPNITMEMMLQNHPQVVSPYFLMAPGLILASVVSNSTFSCISSFRKA